MATGRVSLDPSQYVRVNFNHNPMIVEAAEGEIRVAMTENQPSLTNGAFHRVREGERLYLDNIDSNVWIYGKQGVKAIVTELLAESYVSAYAESVSIGTDQPVIVVRNSSTNTSKASLARISVSCDKKSSFKVWYTTDATAITGATYAPVTIGAMETDSPDVNASAVRATAVDTAKLTQVTSFYVAAASRVVVDNPNPTKIEFFISPGMYLVVTGTASTGVADCVIEWGEYI